MAGLNEFERWIKLAQDTGAPGDFRQALVNVHDTLWAAWKSAKSTFGDKAKPEHALEICRQMMAEHERLRAEAEFSTERLDDDSDDE